MVKMAIAYFIGISRALNVSNDTRQADIFPIFAI